MTDMDERFAKRRLLLVSNSKPHGRDYLDHCEEAIKSFLGPIKTILFFPFALKDHDGYAKIARERFAKMGIELTSIHTAHPEDVCRFIALAGAFFVGGGNTFRLLSWLQQCAHDRFHGYVPLDEIRNRLQNGMPYIGTSAGANVAGPTIMTTNDMPIVGPKEGFKALNIFPFQINPHYMDPDPSSKHMGETRDTRLKEFHEENDTPVIALREGAWLRVENGVTHLEGTNGAKLFRRGQDPIELANGPLIIES